MRIKHLCVLLQLANRNYSHFREGGKSIHSAYVHFSVFGSRFLLHTCMLQQKKQTIFYLCNACESESKANLPNVAYEFNYMYALFTLYRVRGCV